MSCTLTEIKGSRQKWVCRTAEAKEDYKKGVEKPKRDWCSECAAAEDRYKTNVDAAHKREAFAKGVKKTGQQGFLQKTLTKGPTRYAQGIADGADAFAKGFEPYRNAFSGISLPAKYPKGDPRNLERVKAVSTTLGRKKVELAGSKETTCK